jgi:hypothetical protein
MEMRHQDLADSETFEQTMITQPFSTQKSGLLSLPSAIQGITITKQTRSGSHAGSRIVGIYELLEQCLLELPMKDILLAQRVSKRFDAIINTSPRLREKLFFTSRLKFETAFKAHLNPLLMRNDVMAAIPLFFDHKEKRLASCYQQGYTRLYCRSITATTVWVYLEFSSDKPSGEFEEGRYQTETLGKGSWERMFISQPSCFFSWRVQLPNPGAGDSRGIYSGIVKGAKTMGSLLGGLVDSLVVQQ